MRPEPARGALAATNAGPTDAAADDERVLRAGFQALATVVRHYRALAVRRQDGTSPVVAVDPSEPRELMTELAASVDEALGQARASGRPVLRGPFVAAGKPEYLYAAPVGERAAVVLVLDPRPILAALHPRTTARLVVADPAGNLWLGCDRRERCHLVPNTPGAAGPSGGAGISDGDRAARDALASQLGAAPHTEVVAEGLAAAVGLPARRAVLSTARVEALVDHPFTVALLATTAPLEGRERALVRQLLVTAIGLALAMLGVGAFILRQQRQAVELRERLRAAESMQALERQLIRAEKLATTGALTAGIAHEIGTPLGIIRGRAELLLEQVTPGTSARALEAIVQQIDRIAATIRQLLDFAREQPVAVRAVELAPALAAAVELLEHRFAKKRIEVSIACAPGLSVAADPDQLQQVLVNVLLNAADACPEVAGRVALRVARTAADDAGAAATPGGEPTAARLEIEDNGHGIPEGQLNAVFDPFFSTKPRGEGTGLGLSVVASIVRNHGGRISIASAEGRGTTVTIIWPCARAAPSLTEEDVKAARVDR